MRRGRLGPLAILLAGIGLLAAIIAVPVLLFAYVGAGNAIAVSPSGLRYRLLIAGTPIETMPRIAELEDGLFFFYSARDGTAAETRGVRYASGASPESVLAAYSSACTEGAFGPGGRVAEAGSGSLSCRSDEAVGTVRLVGEAGALWVTVEFASP
ncbi:MAG: hypothetical protein HKM95_07530 [Inquilinus sp.]|nr:hypothetical protein [Inquilinus sp.]